MVSVATLSSNCASCKEDDEQEQCPVFHKEESNMKYVPVLQIPSYYCWGLYQDAAELNYSWPDYTVK